MARLIDRFSALSAFGLELGTAMAAGHVPASLGRLQERALLLLDAARADALAAGTAPAQVEAACFAMVAWIDELITRAPGWNGSRPTLQAQLFNSDNAQSEFFHHLAGLTARDNEVREVYLDVLEKGFKGQYYFEAGDGGELGKLKRLHGLQLHAQSLAARSSTPGAAQAAGRDSASAPSIFGLPSNFGDMPLRSHANAPHAERPMRPDAPRMAHADSPHKPRRAFTPMRVGGVIAVLMLLAIVGWWL